MKKIGIISYNIYCNFTNYGSALQTFGVYNALNKISNGRYEAVLINYCPDCLKKLNPLNPMKNMWDKDEESRKMCELSLPAIKENYYKFNDFYNSKFIQTKVKYDSSNFNAIIDEKIDKFVCGSDTIFCIDEFGFDDGYYANYNIMRNNSISYAASFGDATFSKEGEKSVLFSRLNNFKALALREDKFIEEISENISIPVKRVIDPTLLLEPADYEKIMVPNAYKDKKYILLYARRYNSKMEKYAEELSKKTGYEIIEISLRATNSKKHIMFYEAGVEEFLSLVRDAQFVVTNSYHGIIFSIQFKKDFIGFSREQCGNKIKELLDWFEIGDRLIVNGDEQFESIDYDKVHNIIKEKRKESYDYLNRELEILLNEEV